MRPVLQIRELLSSANLKVAGPVAWGTAIETDEAGVYVIVVMEAQADVTYLSLAELALWNQGQTVVYIGRTKRSLRTRLNEFYRHQYGGRRPHRGGQAVKLLRCPLAIYWCPTSDHRDAEHTMIELFKARVGRRPFANRRNERRVLLALPSSSASSSP